MTDGLNSPVPQFGTVEYSPGNRCRICQQPTGGTYYRVKASVVCPSCAQKMRGAIAVNDHAAFVRALAYGTGAAVAGLAGYALIAILLQGWVISYMSIGVGWIVGTAMIKGSNGIGGRRYQIAAAALTYAAVSMAAIPIWIHFAPVGHPQKQTQDQRFEEQERKFGNDAEQQPAERATGPQSGETSDELRDVVGNGSIARAGVSVHSADGQSSLGGHWPVNSFLGDQNRVANNCRPAV